MIKYFTLLFCLMALTNPLFSQLSLPPSGGNQKAMVRQHIGPLAQVTIHYSSPDVTAPNGTDRKGKIWGQLVPNGYTRQGFGLNNPAPWRAGANECTVIEFSHDVKVEGKDLAAGKYSLFIATAENGPWTIIFNRNIDGWGSYFYEEKDNALTVEVTPEENTYHEWLTYAFFDRQPASTIAALMWENKKVPFRIELPNANQLIVDQLDRELTNSQGFTWTNWVAATNFCLQNNIALDKALVWAEGAVSAPFVGQANFTTLSTKAQVLAKLGKAEASAKTMNEAIKHPTASVLQIHQYGRQLLVSGQKEQALKTFEYNMERFGDVWPVRVGLARAHSALGNYGKALDHAKIAHNRAPDQLNKDSLAQAIEKLKKKEDIN